MGTCLRQTSELLCEGEAAEADRGAGRKWEQVEGRRSIGTLKMAKPGLARMICARQALRACSPDRVQRISDWEQQLRDRAVSLAAKEAKLE